MREPVLFGVLLTTALGCGPLQAAPPASPAAAESLAVTNSFSTNPPAPIDSSAAADSLQLDPALGFDAVAALDSMLTWVEASSAALDAADRRILDELVAGAREMYEEGDVEAAQILVADALQLLRQRSR